MNCNGQQRCRNGHHSAVSFARDMTRHTGCLLLVLLTLSSCGGSNSTGANSSEETPFQSGLSGPGDTDNYFPYKVGNFWIYQGSEVSDNSTLTFRNVVYVDRIEQQQGLDAIVLTQTNELAEGPSDAYLLIDAHGLATLGSSDSESPDALLSPYWNVLFPPLSGDQFVQLDRNNINFGEDLDGDGINELADVRSEVLVQGVVSLSSKLADYNETLWLDLNTTVGLTLSSNASHLNLDSTESVYLVKNIGLVERQLQILLNNEMTTTRETLVAYNVSDTLMAGYVPVKESVSEQHSDGITYFTIDAVKGETYLVTMTGVSSEADLLALLPGSCHQSNTGLAGISPEDCLVTASTNKLLIAVEAPVSSNFVLSVVESTGQGVPADEINLDLIVDQPAPGQVGPRGTSRYAATGLVTGPHTVSIAGLSGDADLHVYGDDTYSFELDCTLRAPGDITAVPEECTVDNTSTLYFEVTSGELNQQGASFFIVIH